MDPIEAIKPQKDSSLAMLLAAQKRGWQLYYMQQHDLSVRDGKLHLRAQRVSVKDDPEHWFELDEPEQIAASELDVILMRKDPPFDMQYIHSTYLLELAEAEGVLVVNKPQTLRDANEKLFTAWFPQCCPPTLVSRNMDQLRDFYNEHGDIIIKPLEGMGGASIFRLKQGDPNVSVALETLTQQGGQYIMAQRFIPEITAGDKRILLVNGEPMPFALARIPAKGETRGNLAAGGRGEGVPLSERDRWICAQVGPTLKQKGLLFVGLDVIGDYLTEINVTSPTCIRELDRQFNLDIGGALMDCIAAKLEQ
ncbi:MAG TPA: glutathione synthase [Candidatus Tenderia electrophaga]|uniref:Glutathione synthetase n=1 Tax=Candidatus Tenderia electrophaga TaxID=1748243 RepID=A0A832JAH0_9GAMM|nr:glutathione synthase [Candidatus Tenderia electrophaga]